MARKRNRSDIVADILTSISNKGGRIKQTHLMYKANLSHTQMKSYLEELIDKNLVSEAKYDHYTYLNITDRGFRFLEEIQRMKKFEEAFGL